MGWFSSCLINANLKQDNLLLKCLANSNWKYNENKSTEANLLNYSLFSMLLRKLPSSHQPTIL